MSRIGKKIIAIPDGVKIQVNGTSVSVEGPKGKLAYTFSPSMKIAVEGKEIKVLRADETRQVRALHGLSRAMLNNMVQGVAKGYTRTLEINGVGYRAAVKGDSLDLTLGFSHGITFKLPTSVKAKVENNTKIILESPDRRAIGEAASQIRQLKSPEPYQGKGVKYSEETIRRKVGKAAGK